MSTNRNESSDSIREVPDHVHELLTVDEVASLLRVPKSWIYEHTRKRGSERLPHIKLGKYLRFFETEVREFLERHAKSA